MSYSFEPDLAWEEYTAIEEKFTDFLKHVPLASEHFNVWSLYLGDILIQVGSILDSYFRNILYSPVLDSAPNIKSIRRKDLTDITMKDFREVFEPFYQLSEKNIFVLRTREKIKPFLEWSSGRAPQWWDSYNEVKHDRFKNKKEATLKTVLDSIAGLFLLNIMHVEERPILVDLGVIKSSYAKGFLKGILRNPEPIGGYGAIIYAKSKEFGYVFQLKDRDLENEWERILSPSFPGY